MVVGLEGCVVGIVYGWIVPLCMGRMKCALVGRV